MQNLPYKKYILLLACLLKLSLGLASPVAEGLLKEVYEPIGINFTLEVTDSFKIENSVWDIDGKPDGKLKVTGSGAFGVLTNEMRALVNAYKETSTYNENDVYLFVLEKSDSTKVGGDMPRGKQFGYLFLEGIKKSEAGQLVAHELGHGLFTLQHSWNVLGDATKEKTDNLMDYSGGTTLTKFQWDMAHNPELAFDWLKDDGEGMQRYSACNAEYPSWEGTKEGEVTFTFGELVTAYDALMKDREKLECYKVWFWNLRQKKWLSATDYESATNVQKGLVEFSQSSKEFIEYHSFSQENYLMHNNVLDKSKKYSLLPISSDITENEMYQLAFLRTSQLGDDHVKSEAYYFDLAFMKVQNSIHYYFTNPVDVHLEDEERNKEIHELVATLLFASTNDSISGAVEIIKNRNQFYNKFSWGETAAFIIFPFATFEKSFLAKVSAKIESSAFKTGSYLQKTAIDWVKKFGITGSLASKLTGSLKNTYDDLIKAGYKVTDDGLEIIFSNTKGPIAKISNNTLHIKIPWDNGWATQSNTSLAKTMLKTIESERRVYRLGTLNKSQAGEAQFWAPENPYSFENIWVFADKYGIPHQNLQGESVFFEIGIISKNIPFITREAPGIGNNMGGAIEVVVPEFSIKLENFSTVKF